MMMINLEEPEAEMSTTINDETNEGDRKFVVQTGEGDLNFAINRPENEINVDFMNQLVEEEEKMKLLGLPMSFKSNVKQRNDKRQKKAKQNPNALTKRQKKIQNQVERFKRRRTSLFSKWSMIENEGIEIDNEMFYSITPEEIAEKIAIYCRNKVDYTILIDGFCGVAGNLIQFAIQNQNAFIIGIDLCAERIDSARRIAKIYGVECQCDFICGDFLKVAPSLHVKPDIVFLSPPWNGPNYKKKDRFLLSDLPIDGNAIFDVSRQLTENVAFYLPRNQCTDDLDALNAEYSMDFNNTLLFGQTLNVYFGDLVEEYFSSEESDSVSINYYNSSFGYCEPTINDTQTPSFWNYNLPYEPAIGNLARDQRLLISEEDLNNNLNENLNTNLPSTQSMDRIKKSILDTLEIKNCLLM